MEVEHFSRQLLHQDAWLLEEQSIFCSNRQNFMLLIFGVSPLVSFDFVQQLFDGEILF
jgi:hypothetical protein